MTDVMFFSYRSTDAWWQYLADNLSFTQSTCVVSDMRGDGTINIVNRFYSNIRENDCAAVAIKHFSLSICDEIIRRCRVLRNQKKSIALSMIGGMWLSIKDVIKNEKPRLIISFVIDRYVLDILERESKSHNIQFLSITASIVPNHVMFMDRGKLISLRKPAIPEIETAKKQLLNEKFIPSYVSNNNKFSFTHYWRIFLLFKLRGVAYKFIRYFKRDKLNLHYLDALNHLSHKPHFFDFVVLNYFNKQWENRLQETARDKRVFIGLQLLPEASLDYWLNDLSLLDNEQVILEICHVLGKAGFTLFVKDHPLQFGFRKRILMQKLLKLPFVVLVPYEASAACLIKECSVTVTFTGTIGFESALSGTCSIVSGAYYADEKHFIHFHNLQDIASLPEKIAEFHRKNSGTITVDVIDQLIENILAASVPGDLFSFKQFDKKNYEHVKKIAPLLESFNQYLPQFLMLTPSD